MSNKHIELYELPASLYDTGSPVLVSAGHLLLDRLSEELYIALELKNISDHELIAASVSISLFDAKGNPYPVDIDYKYESLKVKRDETFGIKKLIPMTDRRVRSFSVCVTEVSFSDYTTWKNSEAFSHVRRIELLEDALGSESAARQYRARYGSDCKYMPVSEGTIWYCTCGSVNFAEEVRCHNCHRRFEAMMRLNVASLKKEAASMEITERAEAEEKEKEKKNRNSKLLKTALIVLPVLLVVALIASTVPTYIFRHNRYSEAESLLAAGQFEQAREAFEALGSFSDSKVRAEKDVSYERALYVLSCAKKADASALRVLGITRDEFAGESEELDMFLYSKARELFAELGDYKQSSEKITEIDDAVKKHNDELIHGAYDSAVSLLEKGSYLKARDAFLDLGDYSDSAEMAKEAMYRRAHALLDYVEAVNVRGIYAFVSNDQNTDTVISLPGSVLTSLGSDTVLQLKQSVGDSVDIMYEDQPTQESLTPLCDAVNTAFTSLEGYKDSAELAERALACGDFTAEFYDLLADCDLYGALEWLNTYDDYIPERDNYYVWVDRCNVYLKTWQLHQGDSTIIPYSSGLDSEQRLIEFRPRIAIYGTEAVMYIDSPDGSYSAVYESPLNELKFTARVDDWSTYYAIINQVGHLTFLRYSDDGRMITSCEYK